MAKIELHPIDIDIETMEHLESKERSCGNSGTRYSDGHGHYGVQTFFCRISTCPNCLKHREINCASRFSWMNTDEYAIKTFFNIQNNTPNQIRENYIEFSKYYKEIRKQFPTLWFRFALTSKKIIMILKKEDVEAHLPLPEDTISFSQFISEFVDWSHIDDNPDAKECFLIEHKGKRRILGHGAKPAQNPVCCGMTTTQDEHKTKIRYALKPATAEIISQNEIGEYKPIEYIPVEKLTYMITDTDNKPKSLTFIQFLTYRLLGMYEEEWFEYHGVLSGTRMQKYLQFLKRTNPIFQDIILE